MAAFYLIAGINHFINPEMSFGLIPDYLPWKQEINMISGVAEVLLALMLCIPSSRKAAAILIIAMLVAFIPSHIWFIQIGSCIDGGLCTDEWVAWVRLLVIHPILIFWAYRVGFKRTS